jgi:hypothetical protein
MIVQTIPITLPGGVYEGFIIEGYHSVKPSAVNILPDIITPR